MVRARWKASEESILNSLRTHVVFSLDDLAVLEEVCKLVGELVNFVRVLILCFSSRFFGEFCVGRWKPER